MLITHLTTPSKSPGEQWLEARHLRHAVGLNDAARAALDKCDASDARDAVAKLRHHCLVQGDVPCMIACKIAVANAERG